MKKILFFGILFLTVLFSIAKYQQWNVNEIALSVFTAIKKVKGQEVDFSSLEKEFSEVKFCEDWPVLLKEYVSEEGNVDYLGFKNDSLRFNNCLSFFSNHPPAQNWSRDEKMTYWINAYNIFTIKLIVDNYPLKSIKDISDGLPMINSPWDIKFFQIGGIDFDLNTIEHEILRKQFDERRIHFAINCASISCPRLLNEAYDPIRLEEQLEKQAIEFINDASKNIITQKETKLSKIFDWFESDFTKETSIIEFIQKYNDQINSENKIEYLGYDWGLNE